MEVRVNKYYVLLTISHEKKFFKNKFSFYLVLVFTVEKLMKNVDKTTIVFTLKVKYLNLE